MGHARTVVVEYRDLLERTEEMIRDFRPAMSAGAVIGTVTRCRSELLRSGVRRGLADATERMARAQLLARPNSTSSAAGVPAYANRSARTPPVQAPRLGSWSARGPMGRDTAGLSRTPLPSTAASSSSR
jgi:hypothetical protein